MICKAIDIVKMRYDDDEGLAIGLDAFSWLDLSVRPYWHGYGQPCANANMVGPVKVEVEDEKEGYSRER